MQNNSDYRNRQYETKAMNYCGQSKVAFSPFQIDVGLGLHAVPVYRASLLIEG